MNRSNVVPIVRIFLIVGLIAGITSTVEAQAPQLTLDTVDLFREQTAVPVELRLDNTDPIEAVEIGLQVSSTAVTITDVLLEGGVLDGVTLEFAAAEIDPGGQEVSILWILDSTAPFSPVIAAGAGQLLATLLIDTDDTLLPGLPVLIDFVDGSGTPPATNQVMAGGAVQIPDLIAGEIHLATGNLLVVQSETATAGAVGHLVEVIARNTANVQGFSTVLTFDPSLLQCASVGIDDTITEAVGAEFVEEIIDNITGYAILGVLLDVIPPFNSQVIPATGLNLAIARYRFDVDAAVMGDLVTPLRFVDGLGIPPIENIFVIGNQSIRPDSNDTFLRIEGIPTFLRGDADRNLILDLSDVVLNFLYVTNTLFVCPQCPAITCESAIDCNDDGDADLADGIYLGLYLFLSGPPPPPPFPTEGPDPTPDNLFCN